MSRVVLIRALLTGAFCAIFAVCVDAVLDMLATHQVMMVAALSGFLGSLFAHLVLRPAQPRPSSRQIDGDTP